MRREHRIARVAALAALLVLVLAAAAPAFAHEGHEARAGAAAASGAAGPSETSADRDQHEHGPPPGVPPLLAWVGRFHPATVHFPIGLLGAALLAEALLAFTGEDRFRHATRFCVTLGALGALVAAALGWLFAGFLWVDDKWLMTTHRWLGTGTALVAALTWWALEQSESGAIPRSRFRLALGVAGAFVLTTGFFGGALVYGLDHYLP